MLMHTHTRMNIHIYVYACYSIYISLQVILSLLVQYSLGIKFMLDYAVTCHVGAWHLEIELELERHGSDDVSLYVISGIMA